MFLHALKQKGLSLVEMMIAMSLGAVVTVGVIQLFTANSETYNLMQGQSRMQESARFALDFMSRAIQQAGYKGCWSQNEDVYTTLVGPANIPYEFNLQRGMQGYDAQTSGWLPVLTPLDTAFVGGNEIDTAEIVPGTDVITIRYISTNAGQVLDDVIPPANDVRIQMPATGLEFGLDDLAMIHDCEQSTIFRITAVSEDNPSTGEAMIGHDAADTDGTKNAVTSLGEDKPYEVGAFINAIRSNTFFIAPGIGTNNVGDTPLSLWRKFGTDAPVELVEGIENMQVLYGLDTDNDGTPNQYVEANLVTDYADVVTVRISLTVNSVDDVGATVPPTLGCISGGGQQTCIEGETYDGLIRRSFHQTVQLRNKG